MTAGLDPKPQAKARYGYTFNGWLASLRFLSNRSLSTSWSCSNAAALGCQRLRVFGQSPLRRALLLDVGELRDFIRRDARTLDSQHRANVKMSTLRDNSNTLVRQVNDAHIQQTTR